MSRAIDCCICHISLGEIRDAKLRKGIKHICDSCHISREDMINRLSTKHPKLYNDVMFDDVFGDIFGRK